MKMLTDEQIMLRFSQLNRPGRQVSNLATARKTNTSPEYSGDSFTERGAKTMAKRADRAVKIGTRVVSSTTSRP